MSLRPALAIVLFCLASAAAAEEYTWENFSKPSGLQLNGNAKLSGSDDGEATLKLTSPASRKKGSVFTTFGVDNTGFHSAFAFRVRESGGPTRDCKGEKGGEGLAFVLQGESPEALGNGGGGLGYAGIADSLAIEFDTFCNEGYDDLSSNHIAVVAAGVELASAAIPRDVDDGNVRYVWIDYDGVRLEVRMSGNLERPGDPDLSVAIDVPAIVGGTVCCAGFTASTGEEIVGKHLLLNWTYLEQPSETPTYTADSDRYRTAVIRPVCRNRVGTSSVPSPVAR
ncbi:MAG TPA: L-type lectin-domain containing protein [Nevskiaceae bacterium]|nr:L-type lectin-domain containing protein [Nevskiaceae bacterium]